MALVLQQVVGVWVKNYPPPLLLTVGKSKIKVSALAETMADLCEALKLGGLTVSGFRSALHRVNLNLVGPIPPTYCSLEDKLRVDLLHLMCGSHVQSGPLNSTRCWLAQNTRSYPKAQGALM